MSRWTLEFDGAHLACQSHGSGTGIVFLHAGVADQRSWSASLLDLSAAHLTVAYDRRGYGQTSYQPGPFSHLSDLEAVVDHAGLETVILVGNSMGGGLALDFALAHPKRCRALVLVGTAVSGAPSKDLDPQTEAIVTQLEAAEEAGDLTEVNRLEAVLWLDGPLASEGRVTGPSRDLFLDMNGTALAALDPGPEQPRPAAFDRLGEVKIPTLVIVGGFDLPLIAQRSEEVARRLPMAEYLELADVAHLPALERPDLFLPPVRAFLATV